MTLHQTWIADTIRAACRLHPHAAFRLLQHDSEDEATVEISCLGDAFDGIEDLICFLRGIVGHAPVIGAARVHDHIAVEGSPMVKRISRV